MRATYINKYFFLLALVFLLNACQKDDPIEPNGIKISFQAVTGLKSSADTMIIEEAFIGVEAIDLKREGEADSATVEKIVYEGPYVVDLLNGTVSPAIRWIFAEPGYYREIDVTTSNALGQGRTIVLKGTMLPANDEEKIPFEISSSRNHKLTIRNNTGITISEGENVDLLVVFDLTDLFREVDLNEFEKNEQGVVVFSEDEGNNAVTSLMNAFEAFSSFGINDGMLFPGGEDQTPDYETPGEIENPEDEDESDTGQDESEDSTDDENTDEETGGEDDEPEGGSDDEQNDDASDGESEDSDSNDGGSSDEDEDEGSDGDDDNGDSENNNDGNTGTGNDENPADDDDDDSDNEDEESPGSGDDDEETDDDSGSDQDEQDSGTGSGNEDDSGNDREDDDDDGDNNNKGKGNNSGKGNDKGKDKGK